MEQEYIIQSAFFCNKEKFVKGSKSRENFTQAVTLNADQTLRECATLKRDENILALTSRYVVAADAIRSTQESRKRNPRTKIMMQEQMVMKSIKGLKGKPIKTFLCISELIYSTKQLYRSLLWSQSSHHSCYLVELQACGIQQRRTFEGRLKMSWEILSIYFQMTKPNC